MEWSCNFAFKIFSLSSLIISKRTILLFFLRRCYRKGRAPCCFKNQVSREVCNLFCRAFHHPFMWPNAVKFKWVQLVCRNRQNFKDLASSAMSPSFSIQCQAYSEIIHLVIGVHGWVARICQAWEPSPSWRRLAANSGSSCMPEAPNLHFTRQLLWKDMSHTSIKTFVPFRVDLPMVDRVTCN